MIHSNTSDGSTTFTDSSDSGHTITAAGSAAHDTAQAKFGASSILFGGAIGDYLSIPDHANFNLGTDSFTIDFWVRFASVGPSKFVRQIGTEGADSGYIFEYIHATTVLRFANHVSGTSTAIISKTWAPAQDTWYHIACVRSGDNWALYVNGRMLGTETDSTSISNSAEAFQIGSPNSGFSGWMDEFRLVIGKAMWTSQFVPPRGQYAA